MRLLCFLGLAVGILIVLGLFLKAEKLANLIGFRTLPSPGLLAQESGSQSPQESSQRLTQELLSQDPVRVKAALEQGANPNSRDEQGRPVIWASTIRGDSEIVRLLLQAGADPNTRGVEGAPLLTVAALIQGTKTLETLITAGADLEARDNSGSTALMAAANAGNYEAARLLLNAGADVNALGELKATPLMYAAQHGFDDLVALLVEHGADSTMKASPGLTALGFAKQNSHPLTIALLENGGRQKPPVAKFEVLRGLLYPETPIEQSLLDVCMEDKRLEAARQEMLKSRPQAARELLEAATPGLEKVTGNHLWILFLAQRQLGDQAAALETLHRLLAHHPDLSSRQILRAWKLMRGLGEAPPPAVAKQVFGVVAEFGVGTDVVVVAACADGSPRFFTSTGSGLFGENWREPEKQKTQAVVRLAQDLVAGMAPANDQAPALPKPGRVRFMLLTPGGSYAADSSIGLRATAEERYVQLHGALDELLGLLKQRYEEEGQKHTE